MAVAVVLKLPDHFHLEPEVLEQLSGRPGQQRCIEGSEELLLVLHEVPQPKTSERKALFFWKRHDGSWRQPSGSGLGDLGALLDRFSSAIDAHERTLERVNSSARIFDVMQHAGPLARTTRNLVKALDQVLQIDADDHEIRNHRDHACEIEMAAELLNTSAHIALDFRVAQCSEDQALSTALLTRLAVRITLLVGVCLALAALAGVFVAHEKIPVFVHAVFWVVVSLGLATGGIWLWLRARKAGKS